MAVTIKQGDIALVNFSPNIAHEQGGLRPAVIVSGNAFHVSGLCFVCPITSQLKDYFGDVILTPHKTNGLSQKSETLVGQLKTIDQRRIKEVIGEITAEELQQIFYGLDGLLDR